MKEIYKKYIDQIDKFAAILGIEDAPGNIEKVTRQESLKKEYEAKRQAMEERRRAMRGKMPPLPSSSIDVTKPPEIAAPVSQSAELPEVQKLPYMLPGSISAEQPVSEEVIERWIQEESDKILPEDVSSDEPAGESEAEQKVQKTKKEPRHGVQTFLGDSGEGSWWAQKKRDDELHRQNLLKRQKDLPQPLADNAKAGTNHKLYVNSKYNLLPIIETLNIDVSIETPLFVIIKMDDIDFVIFKIYDINKNIYDAIKPSPKVMELVPKDALSIDISKEDFLRMVS